MPFVNWKHYNNVIRLAELFASIYFILDLVFSFTFKVVSLSNYFYWAFSLLFGVFVSSFCFSDYVVSNKHGGIDLIDEPAQMKRKEFFYWYSFFSYLGLNLLTGFLGLFISGNYSCSLQNNCESISSSVFITLFNFIFIILSLILLFGVSSFFSFKMNKYPILKNEGKEDKLFTALSLLMFVGGEDLLSYLISAIWFVYLILKIVKRLKKYSNEKGTFKEVWKEKNKLTEDFFKFYRIRITDDDENIFLKAYPSFILVYVGVLIAIDNLNFLISSIIIFNLLIIYLVLKYVKKRKTNFNILLTIILFITNTFLTYLLNKSNYILTKYETIIKILGLEIKNYTLVIVIYSIILYLVFTFLLYLKVNKEKKKKTIIKLRVALADIIAWGLPFIFLINLLLVNIFSSLINTLLMIFSIILGIFSGYYMYLKNNLLEIIKQCEKAELNIEEILNDKAMRISISAFVIKIMFKKLLKSKAKKEVRINNNEEKND